MTAPLFAAEHLSVVLAARLAHGCRAARSLRAGPWTVDEMTDALAAPVLDIRPPELHWTEMQATAGPVDVLARPDGPGTQVFRVPGVQVVARVPFSGTPALLEARPRRVRYGVPGTATVRVHTATLAPLVAEVPEEEGEPIVVPLSGYVDFVSTGRTHDAEHWEGELGDWAEFIVFATLDAAAEVDAWKPNARAELERAVTERRVQLDAVAGAA